jgi:hypothetical protein
MKAFIDNTEERKRRAAVFQKFLEDSGLALNVSVRRPAGFVGVITGENQAPASLNAPLLGVTPAQMHFGDDEPSGTEVRNQFSRWMTGPGPDGRPKFDFVLVGDRKISLQPLSPLAVKPPETPKPVSYELD